MSRTRYTVTAHDSILRWRVSSLTRGDIEHVVDLGAWRGNGECSCEHFQFRLMPFLRDGNPIGQATRCGHIVAAREAFLNHVIQLFIEKKAPTGA